MSFRPLVSILMNCHNGDKYLREAIESILIQSYVNWELIFWDNCSTDESAKIIKSYFDKRIRYFRGKELVPLGEARNFAIQKVKGEFIAFLDCDDIWFENKLEKQIPVFLDQEIDIVFSDTLFFNEKGKEWRLYKKKKFFIGECFKQLLSNYFLSLETVVVRKSSILRQSYWFHRDYSIIEEADLFRRIAFNGKLGMVNEVLAKWRVHEQSYTWKKIEQFSIETEKMIIEYSQLFEGFRIDFKNEIETLRERVLISELKFYIETGKNSLVRKTIKGYKYKKTGLVYLMLTLSFFPIKKLNLKF